MNQNPLLMPFTLAYEASPFHQIQLEHYLPAFEKAIEEAKTNIATIKTQSTFTFANTIEALEKADGLLNRISSIFFNLNEANTSEAMQNLAQTLSPMLAAYSNDVLLDAQLFQAIEAVYAQKDTLSLNVEQQTLLSKTYKSFVRNGAKLLPEAKEKIREIDQELAKLSLQFGQNVLAETNEYQLVIEKASDLAGLPDEVIEVAKQTASQKGKPDCWIFTLQMPSYIAFMTYSEQRALRHEMFLAHNSKGFKNNTHDNRTIVNRIVQLRHQRAQILGYESHAHFILEERMAENPQKVNHFLKELLQKAKPSAQKEMEELANYAQKIDAIDRLERWDYAYYAEKLKKEKFAIDDEMLKPYFKLENVIEGVFKVAEKLYELTFVARNDLPTYHPEVKAYEVKNKQDEYVALFYADFFPRESKRGGAWMTSFKGQFKDQNQDSRPHISIVCNFSPSTPQKPSLLTFNEALTLFHEFGHALHGMLAKGQYQSLSGTHVFWDFVELPSQILENWLYEKECLDLFAKHYETQAPIPAEMIEKIKESANFMSGYQTLRQLSFGMLDMAWHTHTDASEADLYSFERSVVKETDLLPVVENTSISCSFSHIFQGGYSAGYYSYKWAEVLDADAFEYFQEKGIFNKDIAQSFQKNILSAGGSEHPMILYKRFRGQEPTIEALLRRSGLLQQ
ncbi:MAG: M3 family peptidase [Cytophagales bacterium]|nr:MAG: M3 family peptidase [Cytophagales bacterium]